MFVVKEWKGDRFELGGGKCYLNKETATDQAKFTSVFGKLKAVFQMGRLHPDLIVFNGQVYAPVAELPLITIVTPPAKVLEAEAEAEYETEEVDEDEEWQIEICDFCGGDADKCQEKIIGSYDEWQCKHEKRQLEKALGI